MQRSTRMGRLRSVSLLSKFSYLHESLYEVRLIVSSASRRLQAKEPATDAESLSLPSQGHECPRSLRWNRQRHWKICHPPTLVTMRLCQGWGTRDGCGRGWFVLRTNLYPHLRDSTTRDVGHPLLWRTRDGFSYIASGDSIPSQLRTVTSSRRAMAAVASKRVLRAGSSSVRMWWRW